jgi:aerobic-type carbon monoxide dehydrogenase small subunit (CoxS/CutS family)
MPAYSIIVNGRSRTVDVEADTPLLWVLRDTLGLTGTKFGCGQGVCGACTVHEAGRAVRSCSMAIADAAGKSFTTIEGLAPSGARGDTPATSGPHGANGAKGANASAHLHPIQQAWLDEDVAQCGYCQPGMIMTASALLASTKSPTDADIDAAMSDSVCRCGTYNRMRAAIKRAAAAMRGER